MMNDRLRNLLKLLDANAEKTPPHITLANALHWCIHQTNYILLEGDRDFAIPAELASHPDHPPTLALIDQLHDLLKRRDERESLLDVLLRPNARAGYDDRGVVCIDISVHTVHDAPSSEKISVPRISGVRLAPTERRAIRTISSQTSILRIPCDSITEQLLIALVQIELDLVSKLSAT
jgi:hypothetical protein